MVYSNLITSPHLSHLTSTTTSWTSEMKVDLKISPRSKENKKVTAWEDFFRWIKYKSRSFSRINHDDMVTNIFLLQSNEENSVHRSLIVKLRYEIFFYLYWYFELFFTFLCSFLTWAPVIRLRFLNETENHKQEQLRVTLVLLEMNVKTNRHPFKFWSCCAAFFLFVRK